MGLKPWALVARHPFGPVSLVVVLSVVRGLVRKQAGVTYGQAKAGPTRGQSWR